MLSKGKINLLLGLCLTSIVSVGFSSWVIGEGMSTIDIDGNIEVDNIINSKEYVYLDTTKGDLDEDGNHTGIECFKYNTSGYLTETGSVTDTGYIRAYMIIDVNKCREIFLSTSTLDISLTLKYADNNPSPLNIFNGHSNSDGRRSLSYSIQEVNSNYEYIANPATGMLSRSYNTSIEFSDALQHSGEKISFVVEYSFFATTGNYFRKELYTYLYGNSIDFALTISVKEKFKE